MFVCIAPIVRFLMDAGDFKKLVLTCLLLVLQVMCASVLSKLMRQIIPGTNMYVCIAQIVGYFIDTCAFVSSPCEPCDVC